MRKCCLIKASPHFAHAKGTILKEATPSLHQLPEYDINPWAQNTGKESGTRIFGAYNQNFRLVSKQPSGDVELSSKRKVQLEATANPCDNVIDA